MKGGLHKGIQTASGPGEFGRSAHPTKVPFRVEASSPSEDQVVPGSSYDSD